MTRVLRSMLYVPANSWRMIANATGEGADAVILDLEDGCPMPEKETGRVFARDSIPVLKEHGLDVFVRVNSLETGMTGADVRYVVVQGIDGIMLAKTQSKEDILEAARLLREEETEKNLASESVAIVRVSSALRSISPWCSMRAQPWPLQPAPQASRP
jgi:citrate lyase subunit beta/citryl-CoA lyase